MQEIEERIYPCEGCGKLRTKAEGGTTFTVCDTCWDKDKLITVPHTTRGYDKVTCDHLPSDPHEIACDLRTEILRLRHNGSSHREPATIGDACTDCHNVSCTCVQFSGED